MKSSSSCLIKAGCTPVAESQVQAWKPEHVSGRASGKVQEKGAFSGLVQEAEMGRHQVATWQGQSHTDQQFTHQASGAKTWAPAEINLLNTPRQPDQTVQFPHITSEQRRMEQAYNMPRRNGEIGPLSEHELRLQSAQNRQMVNDAQAYAEQIVGQANRQAEQILAQAKAEADRLVKEAQQNAGDVTRKAQADGLAAAQVESERLVRSSKALIEETHAWRDSVLAQSEKAVLNLVMDVARSMFGQGVSLDPETLQASFAHALSEARSLGDLVVHAHPEDMHVLSSLWGEKQPSVNGRKVEFVADMSIRRGGCLIEGQYGQVDGRVDQQLKHIFNSLAQTANTPVEA